jgi:hypothetical protein
MILQNTATNFPPPPEGVHNAVCVDVIDLGMQETEWGIKPKLKLTFELETSAEDGHGFWVSKSFTASLHPKATLAQFLSKWRGKPIAENEKIDLGVLIGVSAMLVLQHVQNDVTGKIYAVIDTVAKPQKKQTPRGKYDGAAARVKIQEYANRAKDNAAPSRSGGNAGNEGVMASFPAEDNVPF